MRIQEATGLLIDRSGDEKPQFLGTTFSFRRPDVFLTAAHCVAHCDVATLWIGMRRLGGALSGSLKVVERVLHPTADAAILTVENAPTDAPHSMFNVDHAAGWGERVVSFGYPVDTRAEGVLPTARMMQGSIQRFFDYDDGRGIYRAIELSFPAAQGLSGSPVSRTQDTGAVIGIVAANHDALSYRGGYEILADGKFGAKERDVTRYGIAAFLPEIALWLDEHVPPR